ncbi:MAG: FkbM family methyltransferase [Rhizobiaceae bacterium]
MKYSFCTLVNDTGQYKAFVREFQEVGFTDDICEFLFVDNSKANQFDAYTGLNHMIGLARGQYIILCHQDLFALDDESRLSGLLGELERTDPNWAVASNVGCRADGAFSGVFKDAMNRLHQFSSQAEPVNSVDEHFIVLKASAQIGFSRDLTGFHMYGTDIVLQAQLAGMSAYSIPFAVWHLGTGRMGTAFEICKKQFEAKYARTFVPRKIRTTVTTTRVGNAVHDSQLAILGLMINRFAKGFTKRRRKIKYFIRDLLKGTASKVTYTVDGIQFTTPQILPIGARVALEKGFYELPERELARKWAPHGVPVLELGGAYGIVGRLVREHVGLETPFHSVEANPALVPTLRRNLLIDTDTSKLSVINAAIACHGGKSVEFMVTKGVLDSHLAMQGETGTITAPAFNVSQILRKIGYKGRYTLICDIEGMEFDILEGDGAALKNCEIAIIEVHPRMFSQASRGYREFERLIDATGMKIVDSSANVLVLKR